MKNQVLENKLKNEIQGLIDSRKSLLLSTITKEGKPYASYAPYAYDENALYVLLSEIAIHALNLQHQPEASVLIIEDEDSAEELFARLRVNYAVKSEFIDVEDARWEGGVALLAERHGPRIDKLSELQDFKLFKLSPNSGRYVKGFGKAYALQGNSLSSAVIQHMRDGHKKRDVA